MKPSFESQNHVVPERIAETISRRLRSGRDVLAVSTRPRAGYRAERDSRTAV